MHPLISWSFNYNKRLQFGRMISPVPPEKQERKRRTERTENPPSKKKSPIFHRPATGPPVARWERFTHRALPSDRKIGDRASTPRRRAWIARQAREGLKPHPTFRSSPLRFFSLNCTTKLTKFER